MSHNWIQGAIHHPGAFREYCHGKVGSACISRGLKSKSGVVRKRAVLARTLASLRKRKGAGRRKVMPIYSGGALAARYPSTYGQQGQFVKAHGWEGGARHGPQSHHFSVMPVRPRIQAMGRKPRRKQGGWIGTLLGLYAAKKLANALKGGRRKRGRGTRAGLESQSKLNQAGVKF